MNVSSTLSAVTNASKATKLVDPAPKQAATNGAQGFKSIYETFSGNASVTEFAGLGLSSPLNQISKIQEVLRKSNTMQPKDLLLYQIQIGELNMRVEMLAKVADSAISLTRKLQTAQ